MTDLPPILKQAAESLIDGLRAAKRDAEAVSLRYRGETGTAKTLKKPSESVAYAVSRMPATFAAADFVLRRLPDIGAKSLTDVGAGTGAVVWAAGKLFDLNEILCLESEPAMIQTGEKLTDACGDGFKVPPVWRRFDLTRDDIAPADIVTASYVLNELPESEREKALLKLWAATKKALVLIDPATPDCFARMKSFRTRLIENGAFIVAPCPHQNACPNDWCHFARRVQRSKLHRAMKSGDAPFEDEKFTYLIAARKKFPAPSARILHRPKIEKNKVVLSLCAADGIREVSFYKGSANYKAARKADWGDAFISNP